MVASHTERVTKLPHRHQVNVGGHVRPRTNWVRINLERSSPEPVTAGYADGKDVGGRSAIPSVRHVWGRLLSFHKPYAVSVPPEEDAFAVEGDEQELTDGHIKEPQSTGTTDAGLAHWRRPSTSSGRGEQGGVSLSNPGTGPDAVASDGRPHPCPLPLGEGRGEGR